MTQGPDPFVFLPTSCVHKAPDLFAQISDENSQNTTEVFTSLTKSNRFIPTQPAISPKPNNTCVVSRSAVQNDMAVSHLFRRPVNHSQPRSAKILFQWKDTCWTTLWVAVSGDWLSLSSCRICSKPLDSGCHIFIFTWINLCYAHASVAVSLPVWSFRVRCQGWMICLSTAIQQFQIDGLLVNISNNFEYLSETCWSENSWKFTHTTNNKIDPTSAICKWKQWGRPLEIQCGCWKYTWSIVQNLFISNQDAWKQRNDSRFCLTKWEIPIFIWPGFVCFFFLPHS